MKKCLESVRNEYKIFLRQEVTSLQEDESKKKPVAITQNVRKKLNASRLLSLTDITAENWQTTSSIMLSASKSWLWCDEHYTPAAQMQQGGSALRRSAIFRKSASGTWMEAIVYKIHITYQIRNTFLKSVISFQCNKDIYNQTNHTNYEQVHCIL